MNVFAMLQLIKDWRLYFICPLLSMKIESGKKKTFELFESSFLVKSFYLEVK